MSVPYRRIRIIINPASGKNEPILNTLNDAFQGYELEWEVRITHKFGDATRLAQEVVMAPRWK
jgi:diacylglycerol kinase family enzyme